jgi:hypothetical protein
MSQQITELWLPTDIDLNKAPSTVKYKFKAALASGDVSVVISEADKSQTRRVEMVVVTRLPLAKPKEQVLVADYKFDAGKGLWRNMGARPNVPAGSRYVMAAAIPFTFCVGDDAEQTNQFNLACIIGSKIYSITGKKTSSGKSETQSYELTVPISKATKPQILEVELKKGILESARVKFTKFLSHHAFSQRVRRNLKSILKNPNICFQH